MAEVVGYVVSSTLCVLSSQGDSERRTRTDQFRSSGEFIYVSFLGMPMLIVQDREIAEELMIKRSSQYSYRPKSVMCGDLYVLTNITI